ncbi:hypothetical protein BGZ73_000469 [Actinomortierella ambigua]|nr:hypothetical protein BGZ73_000469 [Actinomortierella ambigua]
MPRSKYEDDSNGVGYKACYGLKIFFAPPSPTEPSMQCMQFVTLMRATLAIAALLFSAVVHADRTAHDGSAKYPGVKKLIGSIEGASVDAAGRFYAVDEQRFVDLQSGAVLFDTKAAGLPNTTFLAASRGLRNGHFLVGDAGYHKVYEIVRGHKGKPRVRFQSDEWLQPNDIAISADGKRVYFSGMRWSEYKGDAWYSLNNGPLRRITKETTRPGVSLERINGIELSGNGRRLFATSARNEVINGAQKPQSAQVYALDLDAAGKPKKGAKWRMVIDLYAAVGKEAALKSGLDPDGMRLDSKGIMYSTLYGHGAVLAWDTKGKYGKKVELITLPTIQSPTNLEMGGKDGRTLVVVGICKKKAGEVEDKACVDTIRVPNPGRAITDLRKRSGRH